MMSLFSFLQASPTVVWCAVGILILLFEFFAPAFILFFFGFSAIVVGLLCLIVPFTLNAQLAIFIVLSIVSVVVLRRRFTALFYGKSDFSVDQSDAYTGKRVTVILPISPEMPGKVAFQGSSWTAMSEDVLCEGDPAMVLRKDNISLYVKAIKKGVEK